MKLLSGEILQDATLSLRRFWIHLVAVSLFSSCTHGGVHVENDYFNPFNHNNDRYYTHGTRFDYIDENETYSIGQNIYTPSNKKPTASSQDLAKDRPYGAWLYGEYRRNDLNKESDLQTTTGLQLGCVGPCALGRQTQQGVHKLLGQGIPAWIKSDELKSEPGFILEYEKRKIVYGLRYVDLMAYVLGKFGNIVDNGSAGATFRMGYNLGSSFQGASPIVFKLPREDENQHFKIWGFTTAEERGVAYNHLLDGSLFQTEGHTVDSEPFVTEIDAGISVGYSNFLFTYMYSYFSDEWKHGGPFSFGGLNFQW